MTSIATGARLDHEPTPLPWQPDRCGCGRPLDSHELDETDQAIADRRIALYDQAAGPRVGDFVTFPDGTVARISHLWRWDVAEDGPRPDDWTDTAQTSQGGSCYLGDGYVSMSGALDPGIPLDTLTDTGEQRDGSCWIFHHDQWRAHNGINLAAPFRVFTTTAAAPR